MILTTTYQLVGKKALNQPYTTELRLYAKRGTQNIASNYTPVTVKLVIYRSTGAYTTSYARGSLTGEITGSYNLGSMSFNAGETTLIEKSKNVYHESDGSKKISIGGNFTGYNNSGITINNTVVDLPTIPRASVFGTIPNFIIDGNENVGAEFSVPITKYYDAFVNTLNIKLDSLIVATREEYDGDTVTFTREELEQIYANMPENSATFTFELLTYSGNDQIGSTQTKTAQGTLSSMGLLPSYDINEVSYKDVNQTIVSLTGDNQKIINGISTLQVNVPVTATAHKGATIARYEVQVATKDGTQSQSNIGIDTLIATFDKPISASFAVNVYDTRGNLFQEYIEVDFVNYTAPTISNLSMQRENNVGEGVYLNVSGTYNIISFVSGENNITKIEYQYKEKNEDDWTTPMPVSLSGADGEYSLKNRYLLDLDVTNEYDFRITVYDKLGSYSQDTTLNSADSYGYIDKRNKILSIGEIVKPDYRLDDGSINVAGNFYIKGEKLEIDAKEERNVITLGITSDITLNSESRTVATNYVVVSSVGDKLKLANGGVQIGTDVKKVLVSANGVYSTGGTTATRKGIGISYKRANSSDWTSIYYNSVAAATTYVGVSLSPVVMEVSQGDVIALNYLIQGGTGAILQSSNTYITVEVIE